MQNAFLFLMKILILFSLLLFCQCAVVPEQDGTYIMHSSGLYVAKSQSNTAVLMSPEKGSSAVKPFCLTELPDGSCTIELNHEGVTSYLGLGVKDGWTTFFLPEKSGQHTQYVIEAAGSKFVKLKNLQTGKYLGTDSNDENASIYSDKSGTEDNHLWRLTDRLETQPHADTLSYMINALAVRQPIEGWGVSLCWWARMCGQWSDEKIDMLVDWMVSPTGLNWNIFRYNIGGGDDPDNANCEPHHMAKGKGLRAEMEGFQDKFNGPYHWERDEGQRKIMLKIKQRRPDAIFEAFSNSAPWWMTYSGCCAGHTDPNKDNLKPEYYKAFAEYLVNVCRHYKDKYGIEFKTLEPFNEPVTNYWYANGSQEGCHFSVEEQVKFIKILHPILKASGLNTVLACSDETDTRQSVKDLLYYQRQKVMNLVGQWNTHTYSATNRSRSQVGSLARAEGKTIWMDEVGAGGKGLKGNLNLCQKFFDDMHYILPAAWIDWQFVEENNDQWCMAQGRFADENSIRRVPNYYVRQQVTRFIKQGYSMVTSLSSKSLAAINPQSDTLIVVLLNNSNRSALHQIHLPAIRMNGEIKTYLTDEKQLMQPVQFPGSFARSEMLVTLPSTTIMTMMIPIVPMTVPIGSAIGEGTYMIIPQSNCEMALSVLDGKAVLAQSDHSDTRQLWNLSLKDGKFRLTNAAGETLTDNGQYLLSAEREKKEGQQFSIEPVEEYFHKITNAAGSAFDLQGQSLLEGTKVGLYPYGNSVSADTRNWQLVRMPE